MDTKVFERHSVLFYKPEDAGNGAMNMKVELKFSMPKVGIAGLIFEIPETVISFHACIMDANPFKISAIKDMIAEDWMRVGLGAQVIAERYMMND